MTRQLLLGIVLCSVTALHAGDAAQDAHDYVSARVQMHIGESVTKELTTNLIDQAAEVLDVLSADEAVEKQFIELHAPLWVGTPTAAYLKKVTPRHDEIAQEVPAAQDALKRFAAALQKKYGSGWDLWARRTFIAAVVVSAVVLIRKWWQKKQQVSSIRCSVERGLQRAESVLAKRRSRMQAIKNAGDDRMNVLVEAGRQFFPAIVRRIHAENQDLKRLTKQPDGLCFNPTKVLATIPELQVNKWRDLRNQAAAQELPENSFAVANQNQVLKSMVLNKKLTDVFTKEFPKGIWTFKAVDFESCGLVGNVVIVEPTIVGYNREYGVVKIANPYFDPRGGRPYHTEFCGRSIYFPGQFRNLVRRVSNKERIREYGKAMDTTAPLAYLVPLAGYSSDSPIADSNHAVVTSFVDKVADNVAFLRRMRGEFLIPVIVGSDDLHPENLLEVGDVKEPTIVCIDTERTVSGMGPRSWRGYRQVCRSMIEQDGKMKTHEYLQRERLRRKLGLLWQSPHDIRADKLEKEEADEHRKIQEVSRLVLGDGTTPCI